MSIAKAVKAKQNSPKISKIWLICCDIPVLYTKNWVYDFWTWTYLVFLVMLFMPRQAFLICFWLKKWVSHCYKFVFMKKLTHAIVLIIAAYCNYLQKFEWQNFIQTSIKLFNTFYWFSNIQENEEKNLLFAFEK